MSDNTAAVTAWIAFLVSVVASMDLLAFANVNDTILATQANCVAATAKAEGYPGNVHGPEAYDLFISKCR